ncbi:MAG: GNAT family N-acetyltransferase [Ilumatobacteraceae bacterium]
MRPVSSLDPCRSRTSPTTWSTSVHATATTHGSEGRPEGERAGAAWVRRMTAADPGYGYVSDEIPELGMAVVQHWRGRGIGRRLLERLLDTHPRMSLSVDDENVGAAGLYRSIGFVPVESAGGSTTMVIGTQ